MCRVLREGPVLCLNQCVFGVDMRSNVSAMCFLVGFVCALVFKVLWHVVISYFRTSMETFMCRKHVCVGVKKLVTLKVHLFHEDQKVYKCRHTLVLLGLRVDYTADRFNSLALTDITADTLIGVEATKVYLSAGTLLRWYQKVIYSADTLAAFGWWCFQTVDTILRWGKMGFQNCSLAFEIYTTLSILLQVPNPNL